MEPRAEPIRQVMSVRANPAAAFELFTEGMGTWWPVEAYSRVVNELQGEGLHVDRLEFQPGLGGAVLEHVSDGRVLPWAEVAVWDPPRRVVLSWRPHSLPEPPTDVDVTFKEQGGGTRVEIVHLGWERVSQGFRDGLYEVYVRGWPQTLERFRAAADHDGAS